MERMFAAVVSALVLSSCVIDRGDCPRLTSDSLSDYSGQFVSCYVSAPFAVLTSALLIDEYERADEESRKDEKFDRLRDGLLHITDNIVEYQGDVYTLDTESLYVEGAVCRVTFGGSSYYIGYQAAELRRGGGGWHFVPEEARDEVTCFFSDNGGGMMSLEVTAVTPVQSGRQARFYSDGPFFISAPADVDRNGDCVLEGVLCTDIYNGDSLEDFCRMTYSRDGSLSVVTSR